MKRSLRGSLFFRARPARAHSCGWKSRHELVTASEAKCNTGPASPFPTSPVRSCITAPTAPTGFPT
ncbi:hypothetical protein DIE18_36640 [Burkholderia sp. Bp9125]|nr:hypothetical protein DIE18_36640 [Burkholderia sp. Bp9125]